MSADPSLAPCDGCPLAPGRAVASRGPVPARLLLLSGAPRYHEEREGVAFASPAFAWLEGALAAAGIDPTTVHYATLTGCRPPYQRPLRAAEIAACSSRLDATIEAVAPEVIVLCGREVVSALLPGVSHVSGHGRVEVRARRRYYPIRHPYATLHCAAYVEALEEDLRRLAALLDGGDLPDIAAREDSSPPPALAEPGKTTAEGLVATGAVPAPAAPAATEAPVAGLQGSGSHVHEAGRSALIEPMDASTPASGEADTEPEPPGSDASASIGLPGDESPPAADTGGAQQPEQLSLF